MTTEAITAFVALFVVIDPIGLAPIFVALTQGAAPAARRAIAMRACAISLVLLTLFGLAGEAVLGFLGISMPAFRIAGGILLFLTALDMLFERRTKRREDQASGSATDPEDDPSIFPLATPLIAGPGAIATMILLTGQGGGDPLHLTMVHGVMAAVLGCVLIMFLLGGVIER
ncbi:MAG: MarC family protein, partial [Pseudomonadota bacterium]